MEVKNNSDRESGCNVKIELNEVSDLVGKLLTIAGASFVDNQQREAVKSLIKQVVWTWGKDWHFAATKEQLETFCAQSEISEDPVEAQIEHLDE